MGSPERRLFSRRAATPKPPSSAAEAEFRAAKNAKPQPVPACAPAAPAVGWLTGADHSPSLSDGGEGLAQSPDAADQSGFGPMTPPRHSGSGSGGFEFKEGQLVKAVYPSRNWARNRNGLDPGKVLSVTGRQVHIEWERGEREPVTNHVSEMLVRPRDWIPPADKMLSGESELGYVNRLYLEQKRRQAGERQRQKDLKRTAAGVQKPGVPKAAKVKAKPQKPPGRSERRTVREPSAAPADVREPQDPAKFQKGAQVRVTSAKALPGTDSRYFRTYYQTGVVLEAPSDGLALVGFDASSAGEWHIGLKYLELLSAPSPEAEHSVPSPAPGQRSAAAARQQGAGAISLFPKGQQVRITSFKGIPKYVGIRSSHFSWYQDTGVVEDPQDGSGNVGVAFRGQATAPIIYISPEFLERRGGQARTPEHLARTPKDAESSSCRKTGGRKRAASASSCASPPVAAKRARSNCRGPASAAAAASGAKSAGSGAKRPRARSASAPRAAAAAAECPAEPGRSAQPAGPCGDDDPAGTQLLGADPDSRSSGAAAAAGPAGEDEHDSPAGPPGEDGQDEHDSPAELHREPRDVVVRLGGELRVATVEESDGSGRILVRAFLPSSSSASAAAGRRVCRDGDEELVLSNQAKWVASSEVQRNVAVVRETERGFVVRGEYTLPSAGIPQTSLEVLSGADKASELTEMKKRIQAQDAARAARFENEVDKKVKRVTQQLEARVLEAERAAQDAQKEAQKEAQKWLERQKREIQKEHNKILRDQDRNRDRDIQRKAEEITLEAQKKCQDEIAEAERCAEMRAREAEAERGEAIGQMASLQRQLRNAEVALGEERTIHRRELRQVRRELDADYVQQRLWEAQRKTDEAERKTDEAKHRADEAERRAEQVRPEAARDSTDSRVLRPESPGPTQQLAERGFWWASVSEDATDRMPVCAPGQYVHSYSCVMVQDIDFWIGGFCRFVVEESGERVEHIGRLAFMYSSSAPGRTEPLKDAVRLRIYSTDGHILRPTGNTMEVHPGHLRQKIWRLSHQPGCKEIWESDYGRADNSQIDYYYSPPEECDLA
eukprot:TRINITY_DN12492_c0_g1_i1.p1 TRINITY_DN12492_c0_g1~~TRINITY_DN12492_c0_g1_i1.p1  ORF type:complete len:1106 (+),score=319.41 TRINITY_DN12492_c0_g1_i1:126-3320(+)